MTLQILDYSDEQIKDLAKKVIQDGCVVLHEQNLTKQQHIQACERFGKLDRNEYFMNPVDAREISIVSGQRNEEGRRVGMFGHTELEWHQNGSARHEFEDCVVSLYCVEECVDTVLSICSQVDCFAELPEEKKAYFREFDIHLDHVNDAIYAISEHDSEDDPEPSSEIRTGIKHYRDETSNNHHEYLDKRPLVQPHHIDGREYLYFVVPFMVGASRNDVRLTDEEFKDFFDDLWQTLFKSKYMFHHVFRRGDY